MNKKYLGGLYDGDGTIMVEKQDKGYCLKVIICQCHFGLLREIQKVYHGTIYKATGRRNEHHRQIYAHILRGKDAENILKDLLEGCIIKYHQVKLALEFIPLINKYNKKDDREIIFQKIKDLNNRIDYEDRPYEELDMDYISGIFDAEGSVSIGTDYHTGLRVKITQKNDANILHIIRDYLDIGDVKDDLLWNSYDSQNVYEYLIEMNKNLIVKKVQVDCVIKFIESVKSNNKKKYTKELHEYRHQLYEIIKKEKHESIEIEKQDIEEYNLDAKDKLIEIKLMKEIELKEERRKEMRKKQSFAKMGEKNPNYGKPLRLNHAKNIALSRTGKNRKLSDDDIRTILSLEGKKSQEEIGEEYGISRQYVAKIFKGLVKPLDEKEDQADNSKMKKDGLLNYHEKVKSMSKEEIEEYKKYKTSLGKRTITAYQMIEILKLRDKKVGGKKIFSTKVNDHIDFTNKKGEKISTDIVKKIWSGDTKLYKWDFEDSEIDMTYEEYLEMFDKN